MNVHCSRTLAVGVIFLLLAIPQALAQRGSRRSDSRRSSASPPLVTWDSLAAAATPTTVDAILGPLRVYEECPASDEFQRRDCERAFLQQWQDLARTPLRLEGLPVPSVPAGPSYNFDHDALVVPAPGAIFRDPGWRGCRGDFDSRHCGGRFDARRIGYTEFGFEFPVARPWVPMARETARELIGADDLVMDVIVALPADVSGGRGFRSILMAVLGVRVRRAEQILLSAPPFVEQETTRSAPRLEPPSRPHTVTEAFAGSASIMLPFERAAVTPRPSRWAVVMRSLREFLVEIATGCVAASGGAEVPVRTREFVRISCYERGASAFGSPLAADGTATLGEYDFAEHAFSVEVDAPWGLGHTFRLPIPDEARARDLAERARSEGLGAEVLLHVRGMERSGSSLERAYANRPMSIEASLVAVRVTTSDGEVLLEAFVD